MQNLRIVGDFGATIVIEVDQIVKDFISSTDLLFVCVLDRIVSMETHILGIGPNAVSLSDPASIDEVFGTRTEFLKVTTSRRISTSSNQQHRVTTFYLRDLWSMVEL